MHETIVVERAIAAAAAARDAHPGARVVAVRLRVGEMEGIEPGALRAAFELLAEGTPAQGARLDVEPVAARLACVRCGAAPLRAVAGHEGIALEACGGCGGRYRVLEGAGWSVEGVTLDA